LCFRSLPLLPQIFDEREALSTLGPGESPRCSEFASTPIVEVERALAMVDVEIEVGIRKPRGGGREPEML
jgi:hypothetical protein